MVRKERKQVTKETNNLILSLFQSGKYSISEIATTLQLCRQTVAKHIEAAEKNQEFISAPEKCKKTCQERNKSFTNVEQTIFNILACNNSFIQNEINNEIVERHNITLSQSTISRKLKKMKLTRKRLTLVPQERNTAEKIEARAIYSAELSRVADENLVFLDETGFNLHTRRKYGYSPENTKAYITVPANRNVNRSLICAISIDGIISYESKVGAFNSDSFMQFIENKLIPYFRSQPNKILIMDNAKFHKSNAVQELFRRNGIVCKFLVPYSPELNPIEEFFSMIKNKYHAEKILNSNASIEGCLGNILAPENNYSLQCQGFFRNMRRWLEKAQQREPFI